MPALKNSTEVLQALASGNLKEHLHVNLELKEDWAQKYGVKVSGLANKLDQIITFLVIGVTDAGTPAGQSEAWARKTEEVLSQQFNTLLDPVQACSEISCQQVQGNWVVIVTIRNPGDVTYWDSKAYSAAGTTVDEMDPTAILALRMQLPGLTDYTNQFIKSQYNEQLVQRFAEQVAQREKSPEQIVTSERLAPLRHLRLLERQAARVLFGSAAFRIIRYNAAGEPTTNSKETGLYRLLLPEFIDELSHYNSCTYSAKAVKEALANAVAHAAYYENDGEVIVEIWPDKIMISNLCISESSYFANRWFSRSHKTFNGLLMEALRVSGSVDELGRGKHVIFAESIKLGQQAPEVILERAGRYNRWKLLIYGANPHANLLRVLDRSRQIYKDERKALIAQALVLWRGKPVKEIRNFVDGDFAASFAEVLAGLDGPIFYYEPEDMITLRRWAKILIGEGKDSKNFSAGEEHGLKDRLYNFCSKHNDFVVTPAILRDLSGMTNAPAEKALSSTILARWATSGIVQKVGHGKYRFVERLPDIPLVDSMQKTLMELFAKFPTDNPYKG
jgi:predicted HTH transcriptional regulator